MNCSTELKIIRRPAVLNTFGFEKSTLYNRIDDDLIPPPVSLGGLRAVGWIHHEIQAVLAAMCSGASQEEIKVIVQELIIKRQQFK